MQALTLEYEGATVFSVVRYGVGEDQEGGRVAVVSLIDTFEYLSSSAPD